MQNPSKDQIIRVSLEQFLKYGARKMTVSKLVEPLGISTKTVYKYFTDKEALLKSCLTIHYKELAKKFSEINRHPSNPAIALSQIWHEAIKLDFGVNHIFYHDLNYYYPKLQDAVRKKVFKKNPIELIGILEDGMKRGYFRKNIATNVVLNTIDVLYTNITRTGKFKGTGLNAVLILENTIDIYLRGLCTQKGIEELDRHHASKENSL